MADLDRRFREFKYLEMIKRVLPPSDALGTIWHYTSPVALLAIIEHGEFWASCMRMLNDSAEMHHGLTITESRWGELRGGGKAETKVDEWIRETRELLDSHHLTDSFVLCASTLGQSQPQFKAYGPYAVGLDSQFHLEKVVARDQPLGMSPMSAVFELGWRRVLYEKQAKDDHVDNLILVLRDLAGLDDPDEDEVRLAAIECIIRATAYMKDEPFAYENEVRLYGRATLANARVYFRVSDLGIVPFVKVRSGGATPGKARLPLIQVNLGLGVHHPTTAEAGLRVALRQSGYPDSVAIVNVAGSARETHLRGG
jgi:hypothetical protein